MLKLTASYSKKVPASEEYSSQHYHAGIEVEIPDNLPPADLRRRIQNTFALVRDSVEAELHHHLAKLRPRGRRTLQPTGQCAGGADGRDEVHDPYFEHFGLDSLDEAERRFLAPLAFFAVDVSVGHELPSLGHLVAEKLPVAQFIAYYLSNVNSLIGEVGYFPAPDDDLAEAARNLMDAARGLAG